MAAARRALATLLCTPSSSLLLPLHRLRLLSTISAPSTLTPFYTEHGASIFSSSADAEHGASLTKRGDYDLDLITIGGGRSHCGRASRFVANFGAKVAPFSTASSDHAAGLARTTGLQACRTTESSIIKPNSSPNQIRSSCQRAAKKKSIRSTQDARHGISPKAMDLIEKVLMLPDVKEVVCKELDKWAISEGKFPIAYVKQAIQVFEREENWSRIIQISEWLVQKEEGKTLRTFEVFLKALDMQQRIDDAEAVWKNDILKKSWSIPTRLVAYVLTMFERHHMPIEVIKLFTMMEDSGRNMDKKSIKRVARAYEQEGFLEMKRQMLLKYNLLGNEQESLDGYKASKS